MDVSGEQFLRTVIAKLEQQVGQLQSATLTPQGLTDLVNEVNQVIVNSINEYASTHAAQTMSAAATPLGASVTTTVSSTLTNSLNDDATLAGDILGKIYSYGTTDRPGAIFTLPPPLSVSP